MSVRGIDGVGYSLLPQLGSCAETVVGCDD